LLYEEMSDNGWESVEEWAEQANGIAPTLVGGSKKHGGPDLGPTRAREAWRKLGVDGLGIADHAPHEGFSGLPRLTVKMAALVQGFPSNWVFTEKNSGVSASRKCFSTTRSQSDWECYPKGVVGD
jgi:DNA (cytosine-5)-methyltransferase 1